MLQAFGAFLRVKWHIVDANLSALPPLETAQLWVHVGSEQRIAHADCLACLSLRKGAIGRGP